MPTVLKNTGYSHIREERDWSHFLDSQYQRRWKLHFAQKTDNIMQTVAYLGRYLKRPPISGSRLRHYSKGGLLTFNYLDHRTGKTERLTLPQVALIARLVEHMVLSQIAFFSKNENLMSIKNRRLKIQNVPKFAICDRT